MLEKKITFDSFIRGIISLVILIGILMLINRLSSVLLPFFIAWLIAYLIYPLVKFFQYRLRLKSRVLSVFCAVGLILAISLLAFYLLVPPVINEFVRVKDLIVTYFVEGTQMSAVPESVSGFIRENLDMEVWNNLFNEENISNLIRKVVPRVWMLLAESINILFSLFASLIILLYLFFILKDYESIGEGWLNYLPSRYRDFACGLVKDVQTGMNRYFRGQAFVAFCVGILFSIGFVLIDFPLAIGLGIFLGILNLVPYLQIVGFIPTILLAILKAADTGQNFWWVLFAAFAVFLVVQVIQDGFIVPKVMGHITGLNPAIILLSLSVWGSLMGIVGLIIALPLTTLLLSYYSRYLARTEPIREKEASEESDIQSDNKRD